MADGEHGTGADRRGEARGADAYFPGVDELDGHDHREDRDRAAHERLHPDEDEEQPEVALATHRAQPAQRPGDDALPVGRFRDGAASGSTRAMSHPAQAEATAAMRKTGPTSGGEEDRGQRRPASVAAESRAPRTALAPASPVSHSDGRRAECTGRNSTAAAEDSVTRA